MTTRELLKTDFQLTEALRKTLKRNNGLCGREIESLTKMKYKDVLTVKEYAAEGKVLDMVSLILGIKIKTILSAAHTEFIYFQLWVFDQLEHIVKLEKELNTIPDEEMIEAGIEDMQKYGALNIVDGLAGGGITMWGAVENMAWEKVYVKLHKTKTENEIREALAEIRKRKRKNKA